MVQSRRELVGFVFTTNRGVELGCVRLFGTALPYSFYACERVNTGWFSSERLGSKR